VQALAAAYRDSRNVAGLKEISDAGRYRCPSECTIFGYGGARVRPVATVRHSLEWRSIHTAALHESNSIAATRTVLKAVAEAADALPDYDETVAVAEYAVEKLR
jgi:hypothetical protein